MDSPMVTPGSAPTSNDDNPRVKFLCSFSGSILPRPQDGKLRYVGGETRIVSVPRDITYAELMGKMRELFEGATVLKYQQPDEDLDALVSVVNDDDVTNMMEEYDKVGSGDGFTRLRIFLFSHPDQDGSMHFVDGDERDHERRYVDALNDSPEHRKQQYNESQVMGAFDDIHLTEQYFNQMNLDGSLHSQRNVEMNMPPVNLRHLTIPHLGMGQPQQSVSQRFSEMDAPWSPAYYSPRQPGHGDRPVTEFPSSPSSSRYCTPYGEFPEKAFERMPEEYRHQVSHQSVYEQPQFTDNIVLFPPGPIPNEKAGFPGNILHGLNSFEGNSICEHCRMTFQRNQAHPESSWKPGEQPHLEPPNMANGLHQVGNPCAECPTSKETFMLSSDATMHHPYYPREQNDPRSIYGESHNSERGWMLQHQLNPRSEEQRAHLAGSVRLTDQFILDNGINIAVGHSNVSDALHVPSHYIHQEDSQHIRNGPDFGNQVFHDQAMSAVSQVHVPPTEERMVRYGNQPFAYALDTLYQVPHGHVHSHALWRNVHSPAHGVPAYEASTSPQLANGTMGTGFVRGVVEGSPRLRVGLDNQNPWIQSHRVVGAELSLPPEYTNGQAPRQMPNACNQENQPAYNPELLQSASQTLNFPNAVDQILKLDSFTLADNKLGMSATSGQQSRNDSSAIKPVSIEKGGEGKEANPKSEVQDYNLRSFAPLEVKKDRNGMISTQSHKLGEDTLNCNSTAKPEEDSACSPENEKRMDDNLSFLPELIASVKEAALESVKEVKAKAQENAVSVTEDNAAEREEMHHETDVQDAQVDSGMDSDTENLNNSKIEPTKAEAEAIERGLQTIRNEDLEEIRELGSGTYGAVYHGKWKGSDVAIKRIKASCFAGKPSERERLIADFWKEALILSSLHHPNVVSFYGVVRDGPDGSLATVTEFMVNGSLKQFLQKKDRTIDRRKRLIIGMDAAFGMEYLHGKNIVHFDLKCENLLVNMRDPHRPVCKIGDLGLSKVKQHTLVSGGVRGTLPWMAPELLSGKSNMVTEKIDVYSFGIVMWELLTGDEPYGDMHCASIIGGIVNNTLRPQIPTWCDPEWKSLMESCWASDPAQRPSFSEISQRLRNMAAAMNLK